MIIGDLLGEMENVNSFWFDVMLGSFLLIVQQPVMRKKDAAKSQGVEGHRLLGIYILICLHFTVYIDRAKAKLSMF